MKKTILLLIATLVFTVNLIMAQTGPLPADMDAGFGNGYYNGTIFEKYQVSTDIEVVTRSGQIVVVKPNKFLSIYAPSGGTPPLTVSTPVNLNHIKIFGNSIIGVGTANNNLVLARYDLNLNLDPSFGVGGIAAVPGAVNYTPNALVIQPDGKTVVVGLYFPNGVERQFVARFTANGKLDPSFGSNGFVYDNFGSRSIPNSVALQKSNIVVGGLAGLSSPNDRYVVVYDFNGNRQTQFNNGNILAGFGGNVAVEIATSKIIATDHLLSGQIRTARFKPDGSIDTGFGLNGVATYDIFPNFFGAYANTMILDGNGRIIIAGTYFKTYTDLVANTPKAFVARFTSGGVLDTQFQSSSPQVVQLGSVLLDFGSYSMPNEQAYDLATQGLGFRGGEKLLVLSRSTDSVKTHSFITRLNGN